MQKRKDIRLKNYDYSNPGFYFLTICSQNRKNLFWNGNLNTDIFDWNYVGANTVRPYVKPYGKTI